MIMVITAEFIHTVIVVVVAMSACSLSGPVDITTLFWLLPPLLSPGWTNNVKSAFDIGLLELLHLHFHNA